MDATSRYLLFGLLTLIDFLSVMFSQTLGLGQGLLGAETFGMVLLLSPFPMGLLGSLNFSLISFFNSNFGTLHEFGTLLTTGILLAFDISLHFCSWFVFTAVFWTFWSWALFTPFCIPLFLIPLLTRWLGLWFPTALFTLVLGILFPTALFTLGLGTLLNTYCGKPFRPGGFSATNTEGRFLGTLPFGFGCALGTTFGIPASFVCTLFLLLSPSGIDTTYDLGVSALDFTTASYHCLVKVFCTHTCWLGRSHGSSLAWASWLVYPAWIERMLW